LNSSTVLSSNVPRRNSPPTGSSSVFAGGDVPGGRSVEHEGALFAGSYLNLFVTGKAVLTARFGDKREDLCAERQLRNFFPGIRMLDSARRRRHPLSNAAAARLMRTER
jgi:hypothetical protein